MWILGCIIFLAGMLCLLYALGKQDELEDFKEELDKREIALDERANRIAADEATLTQEWQILRKAKQEMEEHAKRTARSTDPPRY